MSYQVVDPTPIPFADGLDHDDPMRSPANCPRGFESFVDPHADAVWLLVRVPVDELELAGGLVVKDGLYLREGWDSAGVRHRSGATEREVVEGMVVTLQRGGSIRPPITVEENGRLHVIDGYHRVAAYRSAGVTDALVYLLRARANLAVGETR